VGSRGGHDVEPRGEHDAVDVRAPPDGNLDLIVSTPKPFHGIGAFIEAPDVGVELAGQLDHVARNRIGVWSRRQIQSDHRRGS